VPGGAVAQGQRKGDLLAGKYLLEDCLGIGGMGEVYRATNIALGRQVAIKLLSPAFVNIEEDVLRFLREARAAATVRHVNVVDVLDVARDDDGTPFIVQELLAGEDLERYLRIRGGKLSAEEALEIMIPVADAVATAHANDVVHRDLKPANIFLARDRNNIVPKVLDFGACLFPTIAERSAKEARMLIGTPHYMSPEQIVSKAEVDARSDVWALGIILYEMLVGETPFEADSANAVLQLVKTRDVPRVRDRAKDVPPDLDELIAGCTKRERLSRLSDAGVLHVALAKIRSRLRGSAHARGETLDMPPPQPSVTRGNAGAAPIPDLVETSQGRRPAPGLPPPEPPDPQGAPRRAALLTLSSPGSEPPPSGMDRPAATPGGDLDFDLDLPASAPVRAPAPLPAAASPLGLGALTNERTRVLDDVFEDAAQPKPLALAGQPSSWPPPPGMHEVPGASNVRGPALPPAARPAPRGEPAPRNEPAPSSRDSSPSMPPVLDPRALRPAAPSLPPLSPQPASPPAAAPPSPAGRAADRAAAPAPLAPAAGAARELAPPPRAVPPAAIARPPTPGFEAIPVRRTPAPKAWSPGSIAAFGALLLVPAIAGAVALRAIPAIGTPIGRALRGDATLESGVLAVAALVAAAALSARSVLGQRERLLYVAAGGSVLFGIVMIIVTAAASEAAESGVAASMGGLSTAVAPLAPLVLALRAARRAREDWQEPYRRSDAIRSALVASLFLFLTLALSPAGAVLSSRAPATPHAAGT
jgi:serine/threonine-protein kinase